MNHEQNGDVKAINNQVASSPIDQIAVLFFVGFMIGIIGGSH